MNGHPWAAAATPASGGGWFVILAGLVTAVGGLSGVAALFLVASQRRKNQAETAKYSADGATALTNAAVGLIRPLEDRLGRAEKDNADLRRAAAAHERRNVEQGQTIRAQREEINTLRALLNRIAQLVTAPAATVDPAQTVTAVRDLVPHIDPTGR